MKTSVSREYRNSGCDINGGMLNSLLVCSLLVALSVALEVGNILLFPYVLTSYYNYSSYILSAKVDGLLCLIVCLHYLCLSVRKKYLHRSEPLRYVLKQLIPQILAFWHLPPCISF